jgi:SAM-dependent methyltransferase
MDVETGPNPDQRAEALAERLFLDSLATLETVAVHLGYRLGLYDSLAGEGPATSAVLAGRTGTDERYVREWLEQQAMTGVLEVDDHEAGEAERVFSLPEGHERVLVDRDNALYLAPLARATIGALRPIGLLEEAFRTGSGVPYPEYGPDMREGLAHLNRATFVNGLGTHWLPAVPEVHARLSAEEPARVADIACGEGWSSITIAHHYPNARVDGFDLDDASIEAARRNVSEAGLADRVRHFVQDASDPSLSGTYDLVTIFEAVHDMTRPVDALRNARALLAPGGVLFVADERVAERFEPTNDPTERFHYGWSVTHCLPVGREDEQSAATGTVMRAHVMEAYGLEAGFQSVDELAIEHDFWRFYRLTP